MGEEWKDIPEYEGIYQASDRGRIRSVDRVTKNGRKWKGRILRPSLGTKSRPYHSVQLYGGHVRPFRSQTVHTLVAYAFLGPRPDGMYVCHKDGDIKNNMRSNLYYATPKHNTRDALRHGTFAVGDRCGHAKLTYKEVTSICVRLRSGDSCTRIAGIFGVTDACIRDIASGRTWRHHTDVQSLGSGFSYHREPNRKFTDKEVSDICMRLLDGECQASIARSLGVNPATICNIKKGRNYKDNLSVQSLQEKLSP